MKQFELINPSDPYTFLAVDLEVAALTVFCISTAYGAESEDGEEVPVFIFGGAKEWYQNEFGRTPDEGLESRKSEVVDSLASMMYGSFEDRKKYEIALHAIDDEEKKENFIKEWNDGISSLNDIGTYCHNLAKELRKGEK